MARYIFNSEEAAELLHAGTWPVGADEPHRDLLAAGDLVLFYVGAPRREFVGRAELASAPDAEGVALTQIEEWDAPVPMDVVLSRLDASAKAKADFDVGVVRITDHEYETVLAVAGESS